MSKEQRKSRKRLADLLFLGGGLSVAAMVVTFQTGHSPQVSASPTPLAVVAIPAQEATPVEKTPEPCLTNHPDQPRRCLTERDPFINLVDMGAYILPTQ